MQNNNAQLSALLAMVAQKMGKTPEELQKELQNGSLQNSDKVQEMLSDKDQLSGFLSSPQVQQLIRQLQKKE